MTLPPVSRRIKAGLAAVVVTPALVFAPTAVADTQDTTPASSLPTDITGSLGDLGDLGSISGGQIGTVVTVVTALLDAGVSVGDIITIFTALQEAGVSITDIIAVFAFIANTPGALDLVLRLIDAGLVGTIVDMIP